MPKSNIQTPLEQAFEIMGNPAQLAYALNITPWAVYKWNVNRPPKERCLDIQRLTDDKVTAEQLRPDVNWEYERRQKGLNKQVEEA